VAVLPALFARHGSASIKRGLGYCTKIATSFHLCLNFIFPRKLYKYTSLVHSSRGGASAMRSLLFSIVIASRRLHWSSSPTVRFLGTSYLTYRTIACSIAFKPLAIILRGARGSRARCGDELESHDAVATLASERKRLFIQIFGAFPRWFLWISTILLGYIPVAIDGLRR
jgi:hypothetical protein